MRFFGWHSFDRDFDFKSAGRWLLMGSIVGIISGLGAILFQSLLVIVKEFCVVHLMGLSPTSPGGEQETLRFIPDNFNPYFIVLLPALGGLVAGFLILKFAPEAEGHGTDEAIKAFHRKRGIMVSELSGNYELLMPSMWVCSISFLAARKWSIYQSQVPGKIYSQAHFGEYAHNIFSTITVIDTYNKFKNNMTL
jgi:H+/Cl- antiporter ClcA